MSLLGCVLHRDRLCHVHEQAVYDPAEPIVRGAVVVPQLFWHSKMAGLGASWRSIRREAGHEPA
jgi:hypothetical protein